MIDITLVGIFTGMSVAWLSLKYMFYKFINDTAMQRRVTIDLYDFFAVALIIILFNTMVNEIENTALSIVKVSSFSDIKSFIKDAAYAKIGLINKVKNNAKVVAQSYATLMGTTITIMSLIPLSPSMLSGVVNKYSEAISLYRFADTLSLSLRIGIKGLMYMLNMGPTILFIGIAIRGLPMLRAPSGFFIALGIGLTYVYPLTYMALFTTPMPPAIENQREMKICNFRCMPTAVSTLMYAAPTISMPQIKSLNVLNTVLSFTTNLYLDFIVRHIICISITLIFIRMATFLFSNNLVLTMALERKLGGMI